ncbi:MAG: hypothetical protein QXK93_06685 [Candidatus Bathyarchaeia archaeon]
MGNNLIDEAIKLIDNAKELGIILRLMGAIAVRLHLSRFFYILEALNREITDIDFMALSKQRSQIIKFFTDNGFELDRGVLIASDRCVFHNPQKKYCVDVFFDKLDMCHQIDFRKRLEVDYPTISLSDLLLEKLQIVKINEKDIKDVIALLREHNLGKAEKETINIDYICKILSDDWGFYYTVTENLKKIISFLNFYDVLKDEDRSDVKSKIDALLRLVDEYPKSLAWKLRAKIGSSKKWYKEVEEKGKIF